MFDQIIRLITFVVGAVAGYMAAETLQVSRYFGANSTSGIILFIILGAAIGYLVGGMAAYQLERALSWAEHRITRMPGWEILVGVAGLIIGLTLATLVSYPVGSIDVPYVRTVITVIVFVVFSLLGLQLAWSKKDDFARFFTGGAHPAVVTASARDARPKILDTSIILDGRIVDLVRTRFVEGRLLVPRFVLRELQAIADSEDSLKRNRARRGLDILGTLQREAANPVEIYDADYPDLADVDAKLVRLAVELDAAVLTNDYNLGKVATLQGAVVLSINDLANALKPAVLPGEELSLKVLKEGKEEGQGVGYLDDGTMVVVDKGGDLVGQETKVVVTSVLQTPAGRMIFTKAGKGGGPAGGPGRDRDES